VALLALPFILRQNAWWEWANAYWFLERQTAHVSAHGTPTFFLHLRDGAFYPHYVFYGGFIFSALAYPAAIVGAWPVFAATTAAALAAGYAGIWWTARNLGLSERLAILPAATFATTPYVLSTLYGHGAWAELIAINAAAVMLGGLTAVLWHPERGRGRALAALAASGAIIAGTHNITLLMSSIALPLIVLTLLPLAPRDAGARGLAGRAGLALLAVALGIGLTAAWLVPNLWLGRHTLVADPALSQRVLWTDAFLFTPANVLSPWPAVPSVVRGRSWLHTQPPVLLMAWAALALLTIMWARRRAPDRVTAAAAGLIALGAGLLLLVLNPIWWRSFPAVVQVIQFPYRVITFVAIVAALAITVALVTISGARTRRAMTSALVVLVGAQVAMAVSTAIDSQTSAPGIAGFRLRHGDVRVGGEPASFAGSDFVTTRQFRIVNRPSGTQATSGGVAVSIKDPSMDSIVLRGIDPAGTPLATGLVWSPLMRVQGDLRLSGRTADGLAIVTVAHTDRAGRWHATARSRCLLCLDDHAPRQVLAGRLITLFSAAALAVAGLVGLRRRRTARRAPPATPPSSLLDQPADEAPRPQPAPTS
jgi:hypothetical protein